MYTLGHHKYVYSGHTRYNEHSYYIDRSQQCNLYHQKNVYPGYIRYNEYSLYIDRSQQCIPWVIITLCIPGTQSIMNVDSI